MVCPEPHPTTWPRVRDRDLLGKVGVSLDGEPGLLHAVREQAWVQSEARRPECSVCGPWDKPGQPVTHLPGPTVGSLLNKSHARGNVIPSASGWSVGRTLSPARC